MYIGISELVAKLYELLPCVYVYVRMKRKLVFAHAYYMEYHGDLVRHSICNYCYEGGTKLDDFGTKFDELVTPYNTEVIKCRHSLQNTPPGGAKRRR